MNRNTKWLMTAAASAMTAALAPGMALAQSAQSTPAVSNTPQIEEIVVTAQKREQKIGNVGMAITAATGDQLREQGVTALSGLTKIEPSLQFAPSNNGTPIYTIRGVGYYDDSLAAAPAVSVYQDEVAYTYPVMSKGALLDVSRVEILKGPQGTLYGQNATGGAINFVANQPTDSFEAGLDESLGRFGDNLLDGFVSGPISNTVGFRLAGSTENGGAWQKSDTRSDSLGDKDIQIGRVLLDWHPSDSFKVSLNVNGWTDHSDTQANQLEGVRFLDPQFILPETAVPGGLSNPAYYRPVMPYSQYPAQMQAVIANPVAPNNDRGADWVAGTHPHNDEQFYQAVLRLDYTQSEAFGVTSLTNYEKYTQADQRDLAGLNTESTAGVVTGSIETFSQELRFHGVVDDGRLEWLLGGNYESDQTSEEQDFNQFFTSASYLTGGSPESLLPIAPFHDYNAESSNSIQTSSVFGNVEYHLLDNLDIHAGIRYTQSNQKMTACSNIDDPGFALFEGATLGALNGTGPVAVDQHACDVFLGSPGTETIGAAHTKLDQSNVPWRVGVDWKVTPDDLIYATVSKGYKAGGSPTLGATAEVQYTPVTQEALVAYEAGFKTLFFDKTLQLNASVFHYDYSNKQMLGRIIDPLGIFGALQTLVNIPKSVENGAELSALWQPLEGLTFNGAATYLDSSVTSSFTNYASYITGPTDTINFKGESFPFTPKWSFNYGAGYEWPLSANWSAFVNANGTYQTKTNAAFGTNHADAEGPPLDIRGYGILNLDAGVESSDGHWRAELWGKNVTDTYYWTNAFYAEDTTVRTAGMPATYGITLNYRY